LQNCFLRTLNAGGEPEPDYPVFDCQAGGLQVPFLYSETHDLEKKLVASYLYQVHLYHWPTIMADS